MHSGEEMNDLIRQQRVYRQESKLPLKDIRVIDLTTIVAASFAAALLADFGAEVIKVENPSLPDGLRAWGVLEGGIQPWWSVVNRNKLPVTLNLKTPEGAKIVNRNKLPVTLNLKTPEGAKIFAELIATSDILTENMRSGALDRLGFTAERLFELNKGLIIGRVSGYGQTGPYALRPGFGTLAEGFSGYTHLNAQRGGLPLSPPIPLADMTADSISLLALWLLSEMPKKENMVARKSMFHFMNPYSDCYYQTKDGRWVTLSASAQVPFERLMDAIGKPELKADPRFITNEVRTQEGSRAELNHLISEWFSKMNLDEALKACAELGITAGIIADMRDIAEDPHVRERKTLVDVVDPATGKNLRMPDVPIRLQHTPGEIRFPGLPLGAANEVVYQDLLGYSSEQLEELKSSKVI